MDLGMSFAHKEAWVKLKHFVDQYAQVTGNEVACVTSYMPMSQMDMHGNNVGLLANSTSIHGHGALLKLVRDGMEVAKQNNNEGHLHGSFGADDQHSHESYRNGKITNGTNSIAINSNNLRNNGTHHDQSVARSLSSGYRSLRLDHPIQDSFNRFQERNWDVAEENDFTPKPTKSKKKSRRNSSKTNQENLELDENLMFGEDLDEEENSSDDSDNDSADFSGNSYERPPLLFNAPRQPMHKSSQQEHNQVAASLPVTISRNWGDRSGTGMKFRDNQGPHPPLTYIKAKPPPQTSAAAVVPTITHAHQRSQDTPNPETMMASMQALARSVTNDSALIFGERPRPRLNTGETNVPKNRLR